MNAEMNSAKWLWGGIGLQLFTGFSMGYLVYTIGTLVTGGELALVPAIIGLAVVVAFICTLIALINKTNRELKAEYALEK